MPTPCGPSISSDSGITPEQADQAAIRMHNLASARARRTGQNLDEALKDIAGELKNEEDMIAKNNERGVLLNTRAKRSLKEFALRFPTLGEGMLAFLEGSSKIIKGARNSLDYQAKSLHGKYFGQLVAALEDQGLMEPFTRGQLEKEIYIEMGELPDGKPGRSGSKEAMQIAKILDDLTGEMVSRQNRAGAYITRAPGYVTRQTHDMMAIRDAGGPGLSPENLKRSYQAWRDHTLPLLDPEKTFNGWDQEKFMRNVHAALYTGIHGPEMIDGEVTINNLMQDIGAKSSMRRVLWFKDAESAMTYNQKFGTKRLKDQIFTDLHHRARNIALMEALGPNPELTFQTAQLELSSEARDRGDAASVDSLRSWNLQAAMDIATGRASNPQSPSLARVTGIVRSVASLAKMGSTLLSSFADKAFMQSELAYQGISNLETLGKQITGMAGRTGEQRRTLRLMGVAMDGLIGNTINRYSMHDVSAGWLAKAQQKFFDLNFMNWWTDTNKATVAELMSSHLGEYADKKLGELPEELQRVLPLYEINEAKWDAIRQTATDGKITPDALKSLSDEDIAKLITGRKVTDANIQRERDALDTTLRAYFADRVDVAVPTPGAQERRWMTLGTRAGTPLGEAVRLVTLFKSFPLAVASKILGREVYGRGAMSVKQFIMSDHQGKFHMAQLIAMATAAGYISGAIRDALGGKDPKPLIADGQVNMRALTDAAMRGGGLGMMGDILLNDFGEGKRDFLSYAAGPVLGQLGTLMEAKTKLQEGKSLHSEAQKLILDNIPLINLVYIRPVLNYLILWNLQEMMSPGSLERVERMTEDKQHQDYFLRPSDMVK